MSDLTHLDAQGAAHMVDVGGKPRQIRRATAQGRLFLTHGTLQKVLDGDAPKGDVLAAARIAGIMAAKKTSDLIPLCHHLALTSVKVNFTPLRDEQAIEISSIVETVDRTGVEMEALTAVTVAALTLYDMLKAIDKGMIIGGVQLINKTKAPRSRPVKVVPKGELLPPPVAMESEEAEQTLEAEIEEPEGSIDVSIHELLPIPVAHEAPKLDELEAGVRHRVDRVRQLTDADHQALRAFLLRDRMMAAYQLGDLDDPFIEHTRWFGVDSPEEGLTGVLLWYSGLSMPAILPMGSPDDVMALLARARTLLPRKIFASHPLTHTDAFAQYYRPITVKPVLRMSLQRSDWRPQPSDPAPNETIEKLTHRDTAAIMQLYRYYPDNFFEPAQLDTGMYFGVKQAGELVSVAGIHVLSDAQDIAVVGNMVTHAGKRGQGLATKSVSRVLQAIFERVGYVALNVAEDNASAIACYRKFGFEVHCRLQEGWMERL